MERTVNDSEAQSTRRPPEVCIRFDSVESSSNKWTVFSPHVEGDLQDKKPQDSIRSSNHAPEQMLALVALRLAVLEKAASGLGKLAFVWATVVLLGGFVSELGRFDFWVVAALLLTEGTRVFSRSNELEWQQTNSSFVDASSRLFGRGRGALRGILRTRTAEPDIESDTQQLNPKPEEVTTAKRTWSWGGIQITKFLPAKTVSLVLYVLQLASALVSIGFSLARLASQDYHDKARKNTHSALNLFYALMLAEASVFLLERAYWEFKLRWQRLLHEVNRQCNLDEDDLESIKMFYYKVYSTCLEKSVFIGLDMDLVGFSLEKMQSSIRDEQLSSVKILSTLVSDDMNRGEETRRRIGTAPGAMERLIEMITWRHESGIRESVTLIICSLVQHSSNCFRICAIAGALEGIASLLLDGQEDGMKLQGLTILRQLAKDHRNCIRIGNTSGIVSIIVQLIEVKGTKQLEKGSIEWKVCKKSLQVLLTMADTGGESGQSLRKRIALMVYSIKNLKDILRLEESHSHSDLQALAADVLKSLANDDDIRECIGATGGVIPSLLTLFTKESDEAVNVKAGEALSLLVLQSPKNCSRLLNHKHYKQRIGVSQTLKDLTKTMLRQSKSTIHAAKILRSLCKYLNKEEEMELTSEMPHVLKMVIGYSIDCPEQEAGLALASSAFLFLEEAVFNSMFTGEEHKAHLVAKIAELVSMEEPPPRIRRYSVELVNALMTKDAFFVRAFKQDGIMEKHLEKMLDTVSDVENFYTFSGTMGLTRHPSSVEEIVTCALEKL